MERRLDANFYGCKIGLTTQSQIYYRKPSETKKMDYCRKQYNYKPTREIIN